MVKLISLLTALAIATTYTPLASAPCLHGVPDGYELVEVGIAGEMIIEVYREG